MNHTCVPTPHDALFWVTVTDSPCRTGSVTDGADVPPPPVSAERDQYPVLVVTVRADHVATHCADADTNPSEGATKATPNDTATRAPNDLAADFQALDWQERYR